MTVDKNDKNNWVVARMTHGEGGTLTILFTEQAENTARTKAEQASIDEPGEPVFLYQRAGTVVTEPKAKWQ